MVCMVYFDVLTIIRLLKHNKCLREVIKLTASYDVDDFHWLKYIYICDHPIWLKRSQDIMIFYMKRTLASYSLSGYRSNNSILLFYMPSKNCSKWTL